MFTPQLTTLLALAAAAVALPAIPAGHSTMAMRLGMDCNNPVQGLSRDDCNYLRDIGFAGFGQNPTGNSNIWIGGNGPNVFTFTNKANADVTLIMWDQSLEYASSFVAAHAPKITYSIPRGGQVKLSLQNGVSGAYSAIYRGQTKLSQWGQVGNTWGEFTTGDWATINISREINMAGNTFVAKVSTGCVADMNRCSFVCKNNANTCGDKGTYDLIGCAGQPNGASGLDWLGQPAGGCQGWSNGSGRIDAEFL
ncbi:hypothetical protein QBC37DRAFT_466771 [Rhypophila decipiens]|uniref:Uncharacterized protein n=1 Tax=Rhypophila decipiens TaxID=261697 RepID=A0AAN6Y467_9PEZI|nr:hypothetical protein QBC37DRAFT_466771 [Rhypophila decipiens]